MLAISYIIGLPFRLTVNVIHITFLNTTLINNYLPKYHKIIQVSQPTAQDLDGNSVSASPSSCGR
jgi:hypothetical protein